MEKIFICFASEDRYSVAEPLVYHLKNYGFLIWYDRTELLMGDNRIDKNLIEGAGKAKYVIAIISEHSTASQCFMEELEIVHKRYVLSKATIFPILYQISLQDLPNSLQWIKEIIFKEITRDSGTREICNHIACRITNDLLNNYEYKTIYSVVKNCSIPLFIKNMLDTYLAIDNENINARVSILYATNLSIQIIYYADSNKDNYVKLVSRIFTRLFDETKLCLKIDYRELWLLENSICLLINYFLESRTDSNT